jgi:hypothetical protein
MTDESVAENSDFTNVSLMSKFTEPNDRTYKETKDDSTNWITNMTNPTNTSLTENTSSFSTLKVSQYNNRNSQVQLDDDSTN